MASTISTTNTVSSGNYSGKKYGPALVILTSLFFMWGFITCLNDILIPHLKALFDLTYTQIMLVQFTFFGAYFLISLPAGWLVGKIGYQKGIVLGLATTGFGALMFLPASSFISYALFLFGFFILASGITLLQVAANPYVAALGKPETASSRLTLTQAFNSLGTTIAPLFGAYMILENNFETSAAEAAAVRLPYIFIAAALFTIAIVFAFIKLPKVTTVENHGKKTGSAWQYRHLVLGAVAIFVYVGSEVSIGSFLVNFFQLPDIANLTTAEAGKYVSFYWGGAMVGRFLGSAIQSRVAPAKVLAFNSILAIVLVSLTIFISGNLAMWTIILVGLFNSIMFPTIFTLSIDGLGEHTSQGSGILCMAIVGGALIPMLMGYFADTIGIRLAFFVPLLGYVYILFYGLKGFRQRKVA
jgi:FHS family L-fucose permease-like MFS transporter